jgi:hypothetical protein
MSHPLLGGDSTRLPRDILGWGTQVTIMGICVAHTISNKSQ